MRPPYPEASRAGCAQALPVRANAPRKTQENVGGHVCNQAFVIQAETHVAIQLRVEKVMNLRQRFDIESF